MSRRQAAPLVKMAEYKVKFEVFEGPLDLLLYLIKKEEVDIYEVNLTRLATQFIEYIETMRLLDLEIAGEFLVMAATLMYIKSRELLPVDQQAQVEGEEEGEDPRWELIRQLVEYKKFKDAAAQLQVLEARQEDVFPRTARQAGVRGREPPRAPEASLFDLVNAVNVVLKRFSQARGPRDIFEDKWTVSEKIEHLMRVLSERPSVQVLRVVRRRDQPVGGGGDFPGAARTDPAQAACRRAARAVWRDRDLPGGTQRRPARAGRRRGPESDSRA